MTKILGLSGKKQSGKNTTANFLIGLEMVSLQIVREGFRINQTGQLEISDLFGDKRFAGIFDLQRQNASMEAFRKEHTDPFVRLYSYADPLKQKVCIDILGLTWDQCYGTDKQKNSLTALKWEDMPGVTTTKTPQDVVDKEVAGRLGKYYEKILGGMTYHEAGPMTAREVMQFVGTEIFRKMYGNVWVEATLRQIQKDAPDLAIICDVRFPNEVMELKKAGGKVMRLTKQLEVQDEHESETALDEKRFDWSNFDFIIDNKAMNIQEQIMAIHKVLRPIKWVPEWKEE